MLKNISTILYKDYRIELSQSHLFFSVVLYLLSSIYIIYIAFQPLGVPNIETWVSFDFFDSNSSIASFIIPLT